MTRNAKILLLNPPHTAIGSRVPDDHLPPLGLLAIGGPLIDAGFAVELLDADYDPLSPVEIVRRVQAAGPRIVMVGHAGSSTAHATILELATRIKAALPEVCIVYGGVHPTYHWRETLTQCPAIDLVVRGEGERTAVLLAQAIVSHGLVATVPGIAYRQDGRVWATRQAKPIANLDDYRVGWELIDFARYSYWGGRRAVVVQFSRGCPYLCSYCGQRGFWRSWRHRDPVRFARELAWLHREHGVEVINFADELPTASRAAWQAFLEALIAENVNLTLVGSTRAGDIVRDADILHLYRRAGVIRFLLGIESYDAATLKSIRKDARPREDAEAIRLLRRHGIVSMATYVVGFGEETDRHYWQSLKHLLRYDPDQIQLLYATPHRWTAYFASVAQREVVQPDTRLWDYKHQVLATPGMPPWRLLLWVKGIEVAMQLRPRALLRTFLSRDPEFRHAMRWYVQMGRRVWLREVGEFLFGKRPRPSGQSLAEFERRQRELPQDPVPTERTRPAPRQAHWPFFSPRWACNQASATTEPMTKPCRSA
ncbi:magnesium-protoporphyrin IX monomethyl ester anaerobic oxidative cyclase [Azovibrio restrictus]|uniref:magnesium-protoporphyrin IX monomethyl ester anaerobic oxidative cyclase n=1 Tax=Azovibrio restrictus TaxID=146938 RepID=UPI0026F1392B|nr:magnesium-protoporphyrin IX monomethyl ester anaerobic oxidative cyclase [Azovibrio restrictus]MDD3481978.1 magnesium-protoporphyrin IX monomethyl ester anaerobic oxidative cyclase [Azovibrio restrictus]